MPPDNSEPPVPVEDEDGSALPESAGSYSTDSPSMAFLRDLAYVSDQAPGPFDLQVAGLGEDVALDLDALSSRFLIQRRLGAGGFGTVYEALDRGQGTAVALKVLRRRDGGAITSLKSEFRSLAETVHENLVQLYELHAEGGAWFFTMELVRGTNALAYLRPAGERCEPDRLRSVFRQLACGLCFLHGAGKLHRDIKPSNVMVTEQGRVVLVDFGLAGDIAELQRAEGVFGTPAYMAPEQAAGRPVGPAADWYAFGVMLYQALTGQLPSAEAFPSPSAVAADLADLDQLCADLLAHAPEERPTGPEVRRRLDGEQEGIGTAPRQKEAPFVGRERHLSQLADALAAAERGCSGLVLVSGPSGMGKSALVRRFADEVCARDPGRGVLFGKCYEQESVPYKGVDGLVDGLVQALRQRPTAGLPADFPMLARLFPQLRGLAGGRLPLPMENSDDPLLRPRAFAALRALIAAVAPSVPVLVVDDLQWGDLDGAALLAALLAGCAPLLLVIAYRAEDASSNPVILSFLAAVDALGDRVDTRPLAVGALDTREAEALSRALLEAQPGAGVSAERVRALVEEARGDPLMLSELARSGAPRSEDVAPLPLGALLAARISGLPASARRLLEVVAVEGQPIARGIAARAAYGHAREGEALGPIGVLRAERLIRTRRTEAGDEILPYHDRIREVVVGRIDPEARRGHHEGLALVLEASRTAEPERLLFHYRGAGRLGDAARCAPEAARRAHAALAWDRAARLYREALALGTFRTDSEGRPDPQTPGEDRALRVALADALAGAGRPREAAHATLEAAQGIGPAETQLARRRAAEHLLGAGYGDEGMALLREVLREVGVSLSPTLPRSLLRFAWLRLRLGVRGLGFRERTEAAVGERALLAIDACYAAALGFFLTNPILAAEPLARHLLLALDAGEPLRVARALAFEAVFTALRQGPGSRADALLETARGIAARQSSSYLSGGLRLCASLVAQTRAQWRPALDLAVESESVLRARCTGVSQEIDIVRSRRADILWNLGQIADLARLAPELVEEARERGNRYLEMMVQLSTGTLLGLVEGRPDRAREAVATARERWPWEPGSMLHMREIRALARIDLYEGRGRDALRCVEDGLRAARRTGLVLIASHTAELRMLGGLAALSVGDDARAARYIHACARLRFPWAENMARILQVGLARRAGSDGAVALLGRARETSRIQGAALYENTMSRRLGEWTGGSEGRAQIAAADAWMAGQGIAEPERMTGMLLGWF